MLEEASAQVAQQAAAISSLGEEAGARAAELARTQAQLSSALASLDSSSASIAEQQEVINSLQVEGSSELGGRGQAGATQPQTSRPVAYAEGPPPA